MMNHADENDKYATILIVLSMNMTLGDYDDATVWVIWSIFGEEEELYDNHPKGHQITPKIDNTLAKTISKNIEQALQSQGYITRIDMEDDL